MFGKPVTLISNIDNITCNLLYVMVILKSF